MSILTKKELAEAKIISGASNYDSEDAAGWRETSYDSRVGTIITQDGIWKDDLYHLRPRGMAWVISSETYNLPTYITGITTLKTTWTRKGILTLTAGIVDPGYNGPISTAVINFSKTDFPIIKGETFFRTAFFKHSDTGCAVITKSRKEYESDIMNEKALSSESFLALDAIADDVIKAAFKKPATAVKLSLWAVAIAVLLTLYSLAVPPALNVYQEIKAKNASIENLSERFLALEEKISISSSNTLEGVSNDSVSQRLLQIEAQLQRLAESREAERSSAEAEPESTTKK